jgi:hypothetical protein
VNGEDRYTYDLYTAQLDAAVGITHGLAAVDAMGKAKGKREQVFPLNLLDKGIAFKCQDGEASVQADETRIFTEIGGDKELLDNTVHGVVAAAVLELVLKKGYKYDDYLQAVSNGNVQRLRVDLSFSVADMQESGHSVCEAIGESCKVLELTCRKMVELHQGPPFGSAAL